MGIYVVLMAAIVQSMRAHTTHIFINIYIQCGKPIARSFVGETFRCIIEIRFSSFFPLLLDLLRFSAPITVYLHMRFITVTQASTGI